MDRVVMWSAADQQSLLASILCAQLDTWAAQDISQNLIVRFGSLPAALNARRTQLLTIPGVNEKIVDLMVAVRELAGKLARERVLRGGAVLANSAAVEDYLNATLAALPVEHLRVLFLNKQNRLVADEVLQVGTVDHAPCYPREVLLHALDYQATALIIAHNHPSGDPSPSAADIRMSRDLETAARIFGIAVHDSVVVGSARQVSLRQLGLLQG
jgi:DNA repair protein RadC